LISLPQGWSSLGTGLPSFNPAEGKLTDDKLQKLSENMLIAKSKNERLTLEIGWFPELSPDGLFKAILISENDRERPIDIFWTRDLNDLIRWTQATLKWCVTITEKVFK
jgi:hypothetical protein